MACACSAASLRAVGVSVRAAALPVLAARRPATAMVVRVARIRVMLLGGEVELDAIDHPPARSTRGQARYERGKSPASGPRTDRAAARAARASAHCRPGQRPAAACGD